MFVGHTAVALAARSRTPRVALGWFVAATFMLDLLWPVFLFTGLERVSISPGATAFTPLVFDSYPWSHSLLMACVWSLGAYALARRCGAAARSAALLGGVVVSHWLLDAVTHAPDLPLWPGRSPLIGLRLWDSIPGAFLTEGALFLAAILLYCRATRPVDRIGSIGFWSFILVSASLWAFVPWSPPPPGVRALARSALGTWLFVIWAGWFDRHRTFLGHG
jgi:membrane-bound metal-dependent hydrolase YbcI (DUF457 family)